MEWVKCFGIYVNLEKVTDKLKTAMNRFKFEIVVDKNLLLGKKEVLLDPKHID